MTVWLQTFYCRFLFPEAWNIRQKLFHFPVENEHESSKQGTAWYVIQSIEQIKMGTRDWKKKLINNEISFRKL